MYNDNMCVECLSECRQGGSRKPIEKKLLLVVVDYERCPQ
jgi:hypothetical protein